MVMLMKNYNKHKELKELGTTTTTNNKKKTTKRLGKSYGAEKLGRRVYSIHHRVGSRETTNRTPRHSTFVARVLLLSLSLFSLCKAPVKQKYYVYLGIYIKQ